MQTSLLLKLKILFRGNVYPIQLRYFMNTLTCSMWRGSTMPTEYLSRSGLAPRLFVFLFGQSRFAGFCYEAPPGDRFSSPRIYPAAVFYLRRRKEWARSSIATALARFPFKGPLAGHNHGISASAHRRTARLGVIRFRTHRNNPLNICGAVETHSDAEWRVVSSLLTNNHPLGTF